MKIGNVAHPHLIRTGYLHVSHQIRPFVKSMVRLSGSCVAAFGNNQQVIISQDAKELVSADRAHMT